MLLAIDVGNTNTVFAVYKGEERLKSWRCQTTGSRSADEYAAFLNELFQLADVQWSDIDDVIVSSVVPEANFHITGFCEKYINTTPILVDCDVVPIEIDMDQPQEVGADRLVNASAVIAEYSLPAIVIDFGTATTFDVIDANGRYSGGVIAPGVNLSVEALHHAAAKLPSVSIAKPGKAIGKTTTEAMQSGIYWGYVGLIEGILTKITEEMGAKPFVLATGGLAPLYSESTDMIDDIDDALTLKGLFSIYQNIQKQKKAA